MTLAHCVYIGMCFTVFTCIAELPKIRPTQIIQQGKILVLSLINKQQDHFFHDSGVSRSNLKFRTFTAGLLIHILVPKYGLIVTISIHKQWQDIHRNGSSGNDWSRSIHLEYWTRMKKGGSDQISDLYRPYTVYLFVCWQGDKLTRWISRTSWSFVALEKFLIIHPRPSPEKQMPRSPNKPGNMIPFNHDKEYTK